MGDEEDHCCKFQCATSKADMLFLVITTLQICNWHSLAIHESNDGAMQHSSCTFQNNGCNEINHYARFTYHCRHHHCRICENRQWCTFTVGYELENEKMIGAGLKPTVKDHITAGLWLEPVVFWRALITAGLSQEPTVIGLYHYRF